MHYRSFGLRGMRTLAGNTAYVGTDVPMFDRT